MEYAEELYNLIVNDAKKLIIKDLNRKGTYNERKIRNRLMKKYHIPKYIAERIIDDAVKELDLGDIPCW